MLGLLDACDDDGITVIGRDFRQRLHSTADLRDSALSVSPTLANPMHVLRECGMATERKSHRR